MKRNPLSGSIKAALMAEAIERALANNFGVAALQHHSGPGDEPKPDDGGVGEANLVLPRKQALRDLARELQADLDRELSAAIGRALGVELTDPRAQLEGHLFECVVVADEPGEVYQLDGVPLLWVGLADYEDNGDQVTVHRPLRHLRP